jgi:AcrR family transcriptional regulator
MNRLHPPKQRRSRQTLQRFLDATRDLLDKKSFDDISVAEITRASGASVGAFYARFDDKEGLLEYLGDLFVSDVERDVRQVVGSKNWDDAPLESVVGALLTVLVRTHRRHRGTLRALVLRSLGSAGSPQPRDISGALAPATPLVDQILKRRSRMNHANPDVAVQLGLAVAASAVRERVLYPELVAESRPSLPVTDAVFVEELSRVFLAFLGVNPDNR